MPGRPAVVRMFGIQVVLPSSVNAVISMQTTISRNRGFKQASHIEPVETPRWTRSVFGKGWPDEQESIDASGMSMVANSAFQPRPAFSMTQARTPAITMPPGNHTWKWLSFVVLSLGKGW
jgi:hypothetical protein